MTDIAIIGEVLIELSPLSGRTFTLGISGDTYNSACTLAGLDINTTYITSLGEGQSAELIRQDARQRNVHLLEPKGMINKSPGLYMISNDATGERFFDYWRSDSAAKALFNNEDILLPLLKQIENHNYIYLSGITLALMSEPYRVMFKGFLADYREQGGKVIFDPNYRPKLWPNISTAIQAITDILSVVDIYLPGYEEEESLFSVSSVDEVAKRLSTIEANEIVIKNGPKNCLLITDQDLENIKITPSRVVVDTTGAGDTFNGGYIGGRLTGLTPKNAIKFAARAASQVLTIKGGVLQSTQLATLKENLNSMLNSTEQ
ncbi:MAG: sugar kinase [Alteromonadaceae bacterium]|nr:sugar kinase [Alteromonadaceae bacterium]